LTTFENPSAGKFDAAIPPAESKTARRNGWLIRAAVAAACILLPFQVTRLLSSDRIWLAALVAAVGLGLDALHWMLTRKEVEERSDSFPYSSPKRITR
jgi:hypothetical protein